MKQIERRELIVFLIDICVDLIEMQVPGEAFTAFFELGNELGKIRERGRVGTPNQPEA